MLIDKIVPTFPLLTAFKNVDRLLIEGQIPRSYWAKEMLTMLIDWGYFGYIMWKLS